MTLSTEIEYLPLEGLVLDPKNPRLGRRKTERHMGESEILEVIRGWAIDELAVSFLQNGFWPQEALIVVVDEEVDAERLVVAEGNRRLAALKLLQLAFGGEPVSPKWAQLTDLELPPDLFSRVPVIRADSRDDIETYLGFRHVTGIKEWAPAEKAEYIARLVDGGMTYLEVMRAIGSKTPTVRQNYISYKLLRQLEGLDEIDVDAVERRFSVLFLAIREHGVQEFLALDPQAEPNDAEIPVPTTREDALRWFITWVFGTDERDPLFTDSREMGRFAKVLESTDAVEYLQTARRPTLAAAMERAGTDHEEVLARIHAATDELELSLSTVHLYSGHAEVRQAVERLAQGIGVLLNSFANIRSSLCDPQDDQ